MSGRLPLLQRAWWHLSHIHYSAYWRRCMEPIVLDEATRAELEERLRKGPWIEVPKEKKPSEGADSEGS